MNSTPADVSNVYWKLIVYAENICKTRFQSFQHASRCFESRCSLQTVSGEKNHNWSCCKGCNIYTFSSSFLLSLEMRLLHELKINTVSSKNKSTVRWPSLDIARGIWNRSRKKKTGKNFFFTYDIVFDWSILYSKQSRNSFNFWHHSRDRVKCGQNTNTKKTTKKII